MSSKMLAVSIVSLTASAQIQEALQSYTKKISLDK
jgi:hypothetical protein